MDITRKTPLNCALMAACLWLKRHPNLKADPEILLEFVSAWIVVASTEGKLSEAESRECGIHAVKECACPRLTATITDGAWLDPEDLRDCNL